MAAVVVVVVDRGDKEKNRPANALHAFSQGALFGLIVAGQILYVFLYLSLLSLYSQQLAAPTC